MNASTWIVTAGILATLVWGCTDARRDSADSAPREVRTAPPAEPGIPRTIDPAPAPVFERLTLAGDTFRLADQRGRVVVVNFWATWCAPCLREIPDLIALDVALRDSGLTVVGVSMDHEGPDVVRTFLDRFEPTYPVVFDEGLVSDFGTISGLPVTFLIDRAGKLARRIDGLARPELLRAAVFELLAEDTPPAPTSLSGSG